MIAIYFATAFVIVLCALSIRIAREYGCDQKLVTLYLWAILLWTAGVWILIEIM